MKSFIYLFQNQKLFLDQRFERMEKQIKILP